MSKEKTFFGGIPMEKKGCPKCGGRKAGTAEIATTGTGLTKLLDIQKNHFTVVYCKSCGYSELYYQKASTTSNVIDLFLG